MTRGASARIVDAWRPWSGTWLLGVVWGIVAALVGVLVWVGVVAITDSQSLYFAVAIGAFVGFAVHVGSQRDRGRAAALSALIAVIAVLIGLYYVNRHTFVQRELDAGRDLDIPVFPPWDWFRFVLVEGVRSDRYQLMYLALAPLLAAFVAFRGTDTIARVRAQQAPAS